MAIPSTPFQRGYKITQGYGVNKDYYKKVSNGQLNNGHEGVDLVPVDEKGNVLPNVGDNWAIRCIEDGEVVRDFDVPDRFYGKYVVVLNKNTRRAWWYAHPDSNSVTVGQQVKRGQILGVMGNTGNSSGPHLHLGLRISDANGNPINTNNGSLGYVDPVPALLDLNSLNELTQTYTQPQPMMEQIPKESVIVDLYNILCGVDPSSSEKEWRLKSGKNIREIGNDIASGDSRFFERWIKPHIIEANVPSSASEAPATVEASDKITEKVIVPTPISERDLSNTATQLLSIPKSEIPSALYQARDIVFGTWNWFGVKGWRANLAKLKALLQ